MITKFISLAMGTVTLDVYLKSQLSSNDPLFWVISDNLAVNMLMVTLAALAISVSFRKRFEYWAGYAATGVLAVLLIVLGVGGIFFSGFTYHLSATLLPLDYLLILGYGATLGVAALSYNHAPKPEFLRLPRLTLPVPKISHSPLSSRHRRTQTA